MSNRYIWLYLVSEWLCCNDVMWFLMNENNVSRRNIDRSLKSECWISMIYFDVIIQHNRCSWLWKLLS
jgi:hypothetical protein